MGETGCQEARVPRMQSEREALSCFCMLRSHHVAQAGPELQCSHLSLLHAGITAWGAIPGIAITSTRLRAGNWRAHSCCSASVNSVSIRALL